MAVDWDAVVIGPSVGVFGEAVHYKPATTKPYDITGVYDDAYVVVDPSGAMGVSTSQPALGVQLSEFQSYPKQGDRLVVARTGEAFYVKKVKPDSRGAALLMLNSDT